MIPKKRWTDFSISEWHRLDSIASKYDSQLKRMWLQTVAQQQQSDSLVRDTIENCVIETAITTAPVYGLVFNPSSPIYGRLVNKLVEGYMKVIENDSAKEKVRQILPSGLSLSDRRDRLDTFGLDAGSAVRIEQLRQEGADRNTIEQTRLNLSVQRGNLVSLTEVNRIINQTIETLCVDSLRPVSKSEDMSTVWFFEDSVPSNVTSIAALPKRAKKEIITRRDDRVCKYCFPLDGLKARIGEEFDTEYGYFLSPPFHPRCRCFLGVSL